MITATPSDYLAKLSQLRPGDTLLLSPGNYGVNAQGQDTASVPGLPLFNLNGTAQAPIVITGPDSGPRPVLLGRDTHNTIRLSNTSHVVLRRIEVDGRGRDGFGLACQGPANNITVEDCVFRGHGADQQIVAISTTGAATWGWVIRRNLIIGAGTGIYCGNSDGTSPFVAGLIEYNVFRDTLGYNMQIKHQAPWASVPAGMPTGATATIIRHNVFQKSGNSSTGDLARPNLLIGDSPPSGPGSANGFVIYGNFFYQNPTEALFQGEGNLAFYGNLLVTDGTALRVQRHNGVVRDVRIFQNTVVAGGTGISVSGGATGYTQRVLGNAVFAVSPIALSGSAASAQANVTDTRAASAAYLNRPLAALGELDLYPRSGMLSGVTFDLTGLNAYPDWQRDFNGRLREIAYVGAYAGEGTNPGWRLALEFKP